MKKLLVPAGLAIVCLAAACGKNETGGTAQDAAALASQGNALGKVAWEDYAKMLDELRGLLEAEPPAADVHPKVAELVQRYEAVFVDHGRKREALDESGREGFDGAIRASVTAAPSDFTAWVTEAATRYRESDAELAVLIGQCTSMMQITSFDSLRRQKPDIARRLGI